MNNKGILYIVSTPIGNMGDISARAVETLRSVDGIAAEDTRHSRPFLQKLGIDTPLCSYHDFSGNDAAEAVLGELRAGRSMALISDAGTPLIADPGFKLVRLARENGMTVIPIPGASALTAALSVAGLPTDRFVFEGFLPARAAARQKRLRQLLQEERTCVLFESTHRMEACLRDLEAIFPPARQVFIAREISKKFETHFSGSPGDCRRWLQADPRRRKGEFVIILEGCDESLLEEARQDAAMKIVARLSGAVSTRDAVAIAGEITGARKNLLYDRVLSGKPAGD